MIIEKEAQADRAFARKHEEQTIRDSLRRHEGVRRAAAEGAGDKQADPLPQN